LREEFITNLQNAYSGTLLQDTDKIKQITSLDLNDTAKIELISESLINNVL
jgi:hypothetical protein